jgi:hypothetical protein
MNSPVGPLTHEYDILHILCFRSILGGGPRSKFVGTNWDSFETRGVSHCGLAIYNRKYLKAKEELWKLKYSTNLQKIL